jgi:hypothetical protein
VIFYSWQSDLPNSTNRRLIEDCLSRAVAALTVDDLEIEPSIDRDTQGVAGSPDIANTIFAKIGGAAVFVADVSFINAPSDATAKSQASRLTPNPNVLVEVGYAAARMGWDRIILVHNLATGERESLPFDIRSRRIASYTLAPREQKAEQREQLVRVLRDALETILRAADTRAADVLSSFSAGRGGSAPGLS